MCGTGEPCCLALAGLCPAGLAPHGAAAPLPCSQRAQAPSSSGWALWDAGGMAGAVLVCSKGFDAPTTWKFRAAPTFHSVLILAPSSSPCLQNK